MGRAVTCGLNAAAGRSSADLPRTDAELAGGLFGRQFHTYIVRKLTFNVNGRPGTGIKTLTGPVSGCSTRRARRTSSVR